MTAEAPKENYHVKVEWIDIAAQSQHRALMQTIAEVEAAILKEDVAVGGEPLVTALLTTLTAAIAVVEVQMALHVLSEEDRATLRGHGQDLAASFLEKREVV